MAGMATYAIGDVHGCFASLEALLARLPLDPGRDRLWLVGDLVNRGPRSLDVLRWARRTAAAMGERFACVLGNHDLHLLRRAEGLRPAKPRDTLEPILEAGDGEELVEWLAGLPLLHRDGGRLLVHAGLLPEWDADEAERRAREAEAWLRDPAARREVLAPDGEQSGKGKNGEAEGGVGRGGEPSRAAARSAIAAFTDLRTLRLDGTPCDGFSGPPDEAPAGCLPWYRHPRRASAEVEVVFGHWSALGFHRSDGVVALDSGVVWGHGLTAIRLDDGASFHQPTLEPPGELPADR